jgi:histidine triad (HIT) family protein
MQTVQDINFTNPKIKVPEARMQELAAAIAAKIDGSSGLSEAKPAGTESGAAVPPQLQKLVDGLHFVSESDAPLEAVAYAASGGDLANATLLKLLGEPADAKVEALELTQFLRNHTADDGVLGDAALANRYKALQMYLKQELDGTQVYRVGSGPQIHAYALGRAVDGTLTGFKTVLTET